MCESGRTGQRMSKAKGKTRGFAKVFFWMLRKLTKKEQWFNTSRGEIRMIQICCKTHVSIKTWVIQKTDCEHNHISMNPLKGRRP